MPREDAVKARAKERQGTRSDLAGNIPPKLPGSDSRDELGAMTVANTDGHSAFYAQGVAPDCKSVTVSWANETFWQVEGVYKTHSL